MTLEKKIIQSVCVEFPEIQAIYFFGSFETELQTEKSDVDIALLFESNSAKTIGSLAMSNLRFNLEHITGRTVDLVNLRLVNTVLQKEVIAMDRCIFHKNTNDVEEFEMITLSKYQKLNEERREIIEDAIQTGSFH